MVGVVSSRGRRFSREIRLSCTPVNNPKCRRSCGWDPPAEPARDELNPPAFLLLPVPPSQPLTFLLRRRNSAVLLFDLFVLEGILSSLLWASIQ